MYSLLYYALGLFPIAGFLFCTVVLAVFLSENTSDAELESLLPQRTSRNEKLRNSLSPLQVTHKSKPPPLYRYSPSSDEMRSKARQAADSRSGRGVFSALFGPKQVSMATKPTATAAQLEIDAYYLREHISFIEEQLQNTRPVELLSEYSKGLCRQLQVLDDRLAKCIAASSLENAGKRATKKPSPLGVYSSTV